MEARATSLTRGLKERLLPSRRGNTTVGKLSFLARDSLLIKSVAIAFLAEVSSAIDQIFVHTKQWLLSWFAGAPNSVIQIASSLISIGALLAVFLTLFALISVLERKILARMQNRYGPNRVGPFGLFQPVADGIKMLIKEDIVPARADKIVHFLAPVILAAVAILTLGVIPYGRNMTPFTIDGGILFFFAVGSTTELAVFMAGWASNNKFSMLGAMRAIAQMFSYELPLIITVLPVVMVVGSLMPDRIVAAQGEYTLRHCATLVCLHAVGLYRVLIIFHLRSGGIKPYSVRRSRGRIRNCCRSHDRIFRIQICDVFYGGISWNVCSQRVGGDDVPRRLACARPSACSYSVLCLVLPKAECVAFRLHLASRNASAHPRRSNDERRLEIHFADGVYMCDRRRGVALCRPRPARLAVVAVRNRGGLQRAVDSARHAKKIRAACLSFR